MDRKCFTFQKEIVALQEEVKVPNSLQEQEKFYDSPSTLTAYEVKLEDALKETDKRYQYTSDCVKEKTRQIKEHQKALFQDTKALKY